LSSFWGPPPVSKLVRRGHNVFIEKGAGVSSGFYDKDYESFGANICDSVDLCELIVAVKPPLIYKMKRGQILMAYLHVQKGQNPNLLQALIRKRIISYAYEEIRSKNGKRIVTLGFEAGIVGMYEGLRYYRIALKDRTDKKQFRALPCATSLGNKESLIRSLKKIDFCKKPSILILGKGNVSQGVIFLLKFLDITPTVLYRDKTPNIDKYISTIDILINAVDWYPWEPIILDKKLLKLLKPTALIVDISCDKRGAIESCTPSDWGAPVYKVQGISHFSVPNLPSAIPTESSTNLSKMILPHVVQVAKGKQLESGLTTKNGMFLYRYLKH